MEDEQELLNLSLVEVTLLVAKGEPIAKPKACEGWVGGHQPDTIRFKCADPFRVIFDKGDSPFSDQTLVGVPWNQIYMVEARLRANAPEASYAYSLEINGKTADPEIVVRKDPR